MILFMSFAKRYAETDKNIKASNGLRHRIPFETHTFTFFGIPFHTRLQKVDVVFLLMARKRKYSTYFGVKKLLIFSNKVNNNFT